MTTFITQNFTCHHCNNQMYTYELGSYYVHNSETYSDGYIDYDPPVSFNPLILICNNCMLPLWRRDLVFEELDYASDNNNREKCMDVYDLPLSRKLNFSYNIANYYSGIINDGFADTIDNEVLLRIEIWQLLNNKYRFSKPSLLDFILRGKYRMALQIYGKREEQNEEEKLNFKLFKSNLKRLIEIYKPENENEELLLAEMHREYGNFGKAKSILGKITGLEQNKHYRIIRRATRRRKTRVLKFK